MDLHQLRTFVAIADAGGVARACERLPLSQPAASRQILALEAELGVRLFDRVGRRIQLTSEGEDLLERSRSLLAEANSLGERARVLTGGQTGILRVAASSQVIEAWIAAFVNRFQRRNPGVDVHLMEDLSGRLPERLERGEVHVAQTAGVDERFHWRLLYPTHALAVLPKTHQLARHRTLEVSQLAGKPLLLLRRDSQVRRWIDAAFEAAHVKPRVAFESDARHTLLALAAERQGIAVVPSNGLIPRAVLKPIPLTLRGEPIGRWSTVAWHPQRFLAPYAQRFIEEMVAYARSNNPGRDFIRRAPPLPKPKESGGKSGGLSPAR